MAAGRTKVFLSYCESDLLYRRKLMELVGETAVDIVVGGDFEPLPRLAQNSPEQIQQVREQRIGEASVTMVLIGRDAWRSEQIHQEIQASLRECRQHGRIGLLGIVLPTYRPPLLSNDRQDATPPRTAYCPYNIPAALWDNVQPRADSRPGYAKVRPWPRMRDELCRWIEDARARAVQEPAPILAADSLGELISEGTECWSRSNGGSAGS